LQWQRRRQDIAPQAYYYSLEQVTIETLHNCKFECHGILIVCFGTIERCSRRRFRIPSSPRFLVPSQCPIEEVFRRLSLLYVLFAPRTAANHISRVVAIVFRLLSHLIIENTKRDIAGRLCLQSLFRHPRQKWQDHHTVASIHVDRRMIPKSHSIVFQLKQLSELIPIAMAAHRRSSYNQ